MTTLLHVAQILVTVGVLVLVALWGVSIALAAVALFLAMRGGPA